ncbi:DUF1318 domain-containing protein [Candidatus Woesearchaeota archaeon]|nr:DUF1318 domain-containing protein [Candidatus Woesearchaeota archaeon]
MQKAAQALKSLGSILPPPENLADKIMVKIREMPAGRTSALFDFWLRPQMAAFAAAAVLVVIGYAVLNIGQSLSLYTDAKHIEEFLRTIPYKPLDIGPMLGIVPETDKPSADLTKALKNAGLGRLLDSDQISAILVRRHKKIEAIERLKNEEKIAESYGGLLKTWPGTALLSNAEIRLVDEENSDRTKLMDALFQNQTNKQGMFVSLRKKRIKKTLGKIFMQIEPPGRWIETKNGKWEKKP